MASSLRQIIDDPEFQQLGWSDKLSVINRVEPEFGRLSEPDRQTFLQRVGLSQPGDVRSQIAARKANPPAAALGDPNARKPSLIEQGASMNPGNITVGLGKSALNTGYNIYKPIANVMQGQPADTVRNPDLEFALQPQNAGEAVGQFGGNAAQFLGGGAVAGAAAKGAALGPSVTAAARIPVNAITRAAAQGGAAGLTSLSQGGEFTAPAVTAGVVGAAEPAIDMAARKAAIAIANRYLRTKPNQFLTGANAGEGVVDNGVFAMTQKGALDQIKGAKSASGKEVGRQVQNVPGSFDPVTPLNTTTDDAISAARYDGGDVGRMESFRTGRTQQAADIAGKSGPLPPNPRDLTAPQVQELKQGVGESINWNAGEADMNALRKAYYRELNDMVRVPENANYANLSEAQKAMQRKLQSTAEPLTNHLRRLGIAGLAGGAGYSTGRNPTQDAALAWALQVLMGSTGARLGGAQGLRGLSGMAGGNALAPLAGQAASGMTEEDRYLQSLMSGRQ